MGTKFIPTIAAKDYEAFRRVISRDLPNTYDEWLYLANKMSLDNVAMGQTSEPVEVDPHEFSRFLRATKGNSNLHSLDNFAFEKGVGHKY